MSEFHIVKLAARGARLHLNNESCRIIIEKYNPRDILVTAPGIFEHDGVDSVFIPEQHIIVPLTDITKIEIPVSRFTPDIFHFIEIAW